MSKTIELRKQLQTLLKTIVPNSFHEERDKDTPYPYLVFEFNELGYNYGKTTLQLEINIFDYKTRFVDGVSVGSRVVESLSDTVQDTLNKYHFINNKIQFATYKINRNTIKEEDKMIMRRRMIFELQLHELKEE